MNLPYESLHNHTLISDGSQTHLEFLATAEKMGFGIIAFADHDVYPNAETMVQLRAYDGPVKWILGLELSCGLPTELGGNTEGNLHVLGYFCDPEESRLKAYLEELRKSRYVRMSRQVKHLQSIGIDITDEECLEVAGVSAPGSFHVVKTLLLKPKNVELIERLRQQMEAASAINPELKITYDRMIQTGPVQYPYGLFMKSNSFLPMPQAELGNSMVDFDDAVKLIRGAGGVAVLAHWYFHEAKFPRASLEQILASGRLDGIETAVFNKQNGDSDYSASIQYLVDLANEHDYVQVMGMDAHYAEDFQIFLDSGQADRSIGQTQRLIEKLSPDLTYSNLK